MYTKEKCVNS